jgi:SAM-dependent methyltransferase
VDEPNFSVLQWLRYSFARRGLLRTSAALLQGAFEIARDRLPWRRRLRYGDIDFDWDHRVDTTWSNLALGTRMRELLTGRGYQPSDPLTFHQIMTQLPIDCAAFTFLDLGSGKGRALLMASDYPFRRIIGVELLPELHAIAQDNVRRYSNPQQQCHSFELHCGDARSFPLPPEPLVIFLFDPFPEEILREVIVEIERSLQQTPRKLFLAYQNPISGWVIAESPVFQKIADRVEYAIFESKYPALGPDARSLTPEA